MHVAFLRKLPKNWNFLRGAIFCEILQNIQLQKINIAHKMLLIRYM